MAAEFPHFSAFRPVTSAAPASVALPESSGSAAAAAATAATETGCAEVSTTVDKVEENEVPQVAVDCDEKGT